MQPVVDTYEEVPEPESSEPPQPAHEEPEEDLYENVEPTQSPTPVKLSLKPIV